MDRIIEVKGFVEHDDKIRRNIQVTFLTIENHVTVNSAEKHLSHLYHKITKTVLKKELHTLLLILRGETSELVGKIPIDPETGSQNEGVVGALLAFENVLGNRKFIDQKMVVSQGMRLALHVNEELYKTPPVYMERISWFLEAAVNKGIYNEEWLMEAIESLIA